MKCFRCEYEWVVRVGGVCVKGVYLAYVVDVYNLVHMSIGSVCESIYFLGASRVWRKVKVPYAFLFLSMFRIYNK